MAPPKVLAEYAESGGSSCQECSKAISAGALRLGASSKDPRGFDVVKWFHVDCFPASSRSLPAADESSGFSFIKDQEKDALRNLQASAALDHNSVEADIVRLHDEYIQSKETTRNDIDAVQIADTVCDQVFGTRSGYIKELGSGQSQLDPLLHMPPHPDQPTRHCVCSLHQHKS